MRAAKRSPQTARALLALLRNKEFQRDALAFYRAVGKVYPTTKSEDFALVAAKLAEPFVKKWRIPPPSSPELIRPDPRRRIVDAIASGRWSVVAVFPWTTDTQIRAAVRKVQRKLGRQHQDRAAQERRVQQARWLSSCGIPGPDIAKAVWNRVRGLKRFRRNRVTKLMSEEAEELFIRDQMDRGRSYQEAEQLLQKRARGSEPRATAAIRVASNRYSKDRVKLNVALQHPRVVDLRSHALTLLFRAASEPVSADDLRRRVAAVQQAFMNLTP